MKLDSYPWHIAWKEHLVDGLYDLWWTFVINPRHKNHVVLVPITSRGENSAKIYTKADVIAVLNDERVDDIIKKDMDRFLRLNSDWAGGSYIHINVWDDEDDPWEV